MALTRSQLLVVDDNESSRYTKARILRGAGFDVAEASNGADALRLLQEIKPRLLVLDVRLPDVDGWEICRRIKASPETSEVLVLQVSATYVSANDMARALDGGADGCLTEPIEPPVLVATVRALLRARRAEEALRDALLAEQSARAEAEAADRAKDEFLATLSHEVRSPLNAILTWVTLLRSARLDAAQHSQGLEVMERNTRLLVSLIDDLLDVSKIVTGKLGLELAPVDPASVVTAALEMVRAPAEEKGVQVEAAVAPVPVLLADPARLQQVVWNLVWNAVKFTPAGGRVIVRAEDLGSHVRIRVEDTGKGIAPEFLPHVFERFRQADASSTRSESGLGLGLAIARHLVEMHGGTIHAESAGEGHGSVFTVLMPVGSGVPIPPGFGDEEPDARGANLSGLRVLVVDDERDARDAIRTVLELSGAEAVTANSVREALECVDRLKLDAVVSDIAMPDEDGYALIRRLRARPSERGGQLPALALTAHGSAADHRRLTEAGYQAYATKPIEARELVSAVARLVQRSGARAG